MVLWLSYGIASAGTIALAPVDQTVSLGQSVSIDVNVADIADLFAFQFDVFFDPAILSAASVVEGALFSGGTFFNPGFIDNTAGSITFIADSLSGFGPGISGNGTLTTISFHSIGTGSSLFQGGLSIAGFEPRRDPGG